PSAKRNRAYSAVCNNPGITVASKARKSRVFWSHSMCSCCRGFSPVRRMRCHSACWTSSVCNEASRGSAWVSLLAARGRPRMSWSVGVWRPFSSLDALDGGHDNDSASCLPLKPAAWRSSRSRLPSALRASWTLEELEALFGGKVVPSDGMVPGGITPGVVPYDLGRVRNDFTAEECVVVVEMYPNQL